MKTSNNKLSSIVLKKEDLQLSRGNVEFMMQFSHTGMFAYAVLLVKRQFIWILHVIYSETQ